MQMLDFEYSHLQLIWVKLMVSWFPWSTQQFYKDLKTGMKKRLKLDIHSHHYEMVRHAALV